MDSRNWGMTKREHFAVLILAGMYSNSAFIGTANGEELVRSAISQADALIDTLAECDREDSK
jgi:hypothetical protein